MSEMESNKRTIRDFIETVWIGGDLAALPDFWTEDCVNHAMPGPDNRGLVALRAYHERSLAAFATFADVHIEIEQQVAEGDRVVTQMISHGLHTGPFLGVPADGPAGLAVVHPH